jgi:glycosyltransferase involved in cell wall biosynthesis
MKIALVHDYLVQYGGAEKVLEALHEVWPKAPIFTSFVNKDTLSLLQVNRENIRPFLVSKLPFSHKLYKHFVPLYPTLFKYVNVGDADVVISSSTFAAKFIDVKKAAHICYLHTVPRFLWGYETELKEPVFLGVDRLLKPVYKAGLPPIKNALRRADYNAAQKVDFFVTNSKEVQKRIKKHYERDSYVIHPPVDIGKFGNKISEVAGKGKDYYLLVSRLSEYKRVDIAVQAFNKLRLPLKVVGTGPQFGYLKSIAKDNVELVGKVSSSKVSQLFRGAEALIFPTHEDFGIVSVEAMAAGKPVIAYRVGGVTETVVEGVTGEFFDKQTPGAIIEAVKKFKPSNYSGEACRKQAKKFSKGQFKRKMKFFVEEICAARRVV